MNNPSDQVTIAITRAELEALLRRIVREELAHLLHQRRPSLLDDWTHEGPDDPAGDATLLTDLLAQIADARTTPEARIAWTTARAELARAEEAGELPG